MFPGIKIGHYTDPVAKTGLTVFLPDKAVRCHYTICGAAPASHELALLDSENLVGRVDAILLTGGSAFGLAAVGGVMEWLKDNGRGFPTKNLAVPIVPAAAIYDLKSSDSIYPEASDAYQACANAAPLTLTGLHGAGTGACVGKLIDSAQPMPGGLGYFQEEFGDIMIAALVVVNCVGDVVDDKGSIIAGAVGDDFIDSERYLLSGGEVQSALAGKNTTLAVVFTNVDLSSNQLKVVAKMASAGIARAIRPAFTPYDGDIVFAVSAADSKVKASTVSVGTMAAHVLASAIRQVFES